MLIFLDIDGVMVPAKGHKAPDFLKDGFAAFSSQAAQTLDRLIKEYNATIILTTSHKSNYNLAEWKAIFNARGVDTRLIASLPANTQFLSRKDEILNWFSRNQADSNFVIIDDDTSLNALPAKLKKHFVLTSSYVGLTPAHFEEIKTILSSAG
ncbi:HAD domain-containing protein [uncultured Chitinophaga sp.]|uniref:HAD domain-containing protein n=1 Tax=uncultured Chitinophaga sp. TaxID=339340 RepID=UPI0025EBB149|nr:HAD domain-containing protein [uncultured Chitinophaga sp.]